jgi:hypothetical protein
LEGHRVAAPRALPVKRLTKLPQADLFLGSERADIVEGSHAPAHQSRQREHVIPVVGKDPGELARMTATKIFHVKRRNQLARNITVSLHPENGGLDGS